MGRAFEYRKAAKLKRWGHMAKTFTRLGKQIAIAVKAGGPEPENNPTLRSVIATCKRENMPKDNIERAIKNAMGKDQSDYKGMTYEGYGPHGVAVFVDTLTDNTTRTVADIFKTALFQMFLDSCIAFRITINSDSTFFFILFVVFLYVIVYQVKNEFLHIDTVFLLESEHTLVVKQESQ